MPRKPRDERAGGVYHVYARGNRRQPIFADDADRRLYLELLGFVVEKYEWRLLAYCLMDNHVHLLVETPNPNLGAGMNRLQGLYGQLFNTRHQKDGHLFQGRYGASRAESAGAVMYFAGYVVANPVKAGMCRRAEEYEWSSHAAALGERPCPEWLDVRRLLAYFGPGETGRLNYAAITGAMALMGAAGFEFAATAAAPRP